MRVMLNGESRHVRDALTVDELVGDLGLNQRRIAVEVNREVLARDQYGAHQLREGDVVEIIQFIGGG